jgi:hypothetical protein
MAEPEILPELTQLTRNRRWNQLERCIQDTYSELLFWASMGTGTSFAHELASALKACAEHTRNKDLKSTLSLDFGNFIVLMLDPAEYVAMWHPNGPPPACAICMESLEEPCEIFHRVCEQFVAHPTCFETWAKAGAHFTCPRCKQIN